MEMNHLSAQLILMEYESIATLSDEYGKDSRTAIKIEEWIRINSDRPLSVSAVAEHFGYNEDYISKLFRRESGVGLKAYIDSMRLLRIKGLLSTTAFPLQKISDECGFEDYKAFLKFFTYHEGVTPTKFRTQCYMTHDNNR
jgi:transcriptional regulator GlxA family with amidase domain